MFQFLNKVVKSLKNHFISASVSALVLNQFNIQYIFMMTLSPFVIFLILQQVLGSERDLLNFIIIDQLSL